MNKLILSLKQRFLPQELPRKPEMDMVMYDREQDEQYTKDGNDGALAVVYDLIIRTILRIAPASGEALDVCCGSSQLLCKLARQMPGVQFTGLDLSHRMIHFAGESKAQYGVSNVDFKIGSMYEMDRLFEKRFDMVTWHLAMHHCDCDENVIAVFNQLRRVLKDDGVLFIFDLVRPKTGKLALAYADLFNRRWGDWYYHDSLDSYKAAFSFEEVDELLRRSELKDYRHIEPYIGNLFQMIVIANAWRANSKKIDNLRHAWQRLDYALLRAMFGGRI